MAGLADTTNNAVEPSVLQATYAGAKRRIATLELQIQALQAADSQQKKTAVSDVTRGRVVTRLVSLFEPVEDLVNESDRRRALEVVSDDEEEPQPPAEHSLDQRRTQRGYELLVKNIPSIEAKLVEFDTHELGVHFRELRKGACGARGDDAANLKPTVISWIVSLFENPTPPLEPTAKSDRGFEHDSTGRLLCPMDYDWDDAVVRQQIRDGHPDFPVTGDGWPSFLYPHAKGDINDIENGLMKSALLVKAYKFIFTSPSSAQDIDCEIDTDQTAKPYKRARKHKAPTRGHIANILRMKIVTPRSIAYVAVQLRFALSNASSWSVDDGCFNYIVFYNMIIDFFEEAVGLAAKARAQALLSWWSSKIFGSHATASDQALARGRASVSKLAQQRAAKELAPS